MVLFCTVCKKKSSINLLSYLNSFSVVIDFYEMLLSFLFCPMVLCFAPQDHNTVLNGIDLTVGMFNAVKKRKCTLLFQCFSIFSVIVERML